MKSRPTITQIVVLGDSLSDRGTMNKRKFEGVIPLRALAGLNGSPEGRFTNGFAWDDDFTTMILSHLFAQQQVRQLHRSVTDVSDAVIDHSSRNQFAYSLQNDRVIKFEAQAFMRTFAEGGCAAADYKHESVFNKEFFARQMLATLAEKRAQLIANDEKHKTSQDQKNQTLVIEWSGANDFITVNEKPSEAIADKAIAARIENAEELIKNGYRQFILMGLPNLALTPRFQMFGKDAQDEASRCSVYFNDQLRQACIKLQQAHPEVKIDFFDINETFKDVYENPEKYHFSRDKIKTPFIHSPDFNNQDGISHAHDYMFWDEVHPTAELHAYLAQALFNQYANHFNWRAPEHKIISSAQVLFDQFMQKYMTQLKADRNGWLGSVRTTNLLPKLKRVTLGDESLEDESSYIDAIAIVIQHAKDDETNRTRGILCQLGWMDKHGDVNLSIPALAEANKQVVGFSAATAKIY